MGYDLIQRAYKENPKLYTALILTTHDESNQRIKKLLEENRVETNYLNNPVTPNDLLELVEKLFGK